MSPFGSFLLCLLVGASSLRSAAEVVNGTDPRTTAWLEEQHLGIHPDGKGSFLAAAPAYDLHYRIGEYGMVVHGSGWSTALRFQGVQRPGGERKAWLPGAACANGTELIWKGQGMDLQYLHGPEGLRQNFLLNERPAGAGPLELVLDRSGDGCLGSDGPTGVLFTNDDGVGLFTYRDLKVWDACGNVLQASLRPTADGDQVIITVNDAGATWPLTVDPIATTPNRFILAATGHREFGFAVSSAGDLNGDGYSDVAVGDPLASFGQAQEGVVHVFYGSATGIGAVPDVILQCNQDSAQFGWSVGHAGDVNGDGYSDLLVGADFWESTPTQDHEGAVFVYHGSATGLATVPAIMLQIDQDDAGMGSKVCGVGDLNGDGYGDIFLGARLAQSGSTQINEGWGFVHLGSAAGITATWAHRLERNQGGAQFGYSAGGGDINGDGFDDLVVGAYRYDLLVPAGGDDGAVFVYYGGAGGVGSSNPLGPGANPAPAQIFNSSGISSKIAWSLAVAGDVNGDGYADVVAGHYLDNIGGPLQEGIAFVFHGSATGLNTVPSTILQGGMLNAWFGRSVSSAGDVNSDGYADIIVGAVTYTGTLSQQGAAFVYLGGPAGISPTYFVRYLGANNVANMGESVAVAGDVNGDGYSDMIVGSKGQSSRGAMGVYHGGGYLVSAPGPVAPALHAFSGSAGAHDGWSVANAGDVNGDGYSDAISGAPDASSGEAGEGLAFLRYGGPNGLPAAPSVTLQVNLTGAAFGYCVATAGDVNGDGYADVVVGAPNAAGTGRAYIFMGGPGGLATSAALTLIGTPGSRFGAAVSTAGDLDSDGYADLLVAAPVNGTVAVHHGTPSGTDPVAHTVLTGPQAASRFGAALATAGDLDGDGYSDILIGAPDYSNGGLNEGGVYIHRGSELGVGSVAEATLEVNVAGAHFGTSVAGAGDVNGDGFSDVLVGAPDWASGQAGEGGAFVFHGSAGGVSATPNGTIIQPNVVGAGLGRSVSEGGDVNGDGYADVVVGAPYLTSGQANEGWIYVAQGSPAGIGTSDVQESNVVGQRMGWSVAGGGDVDGDGNSDVLVGSPYATSVNTEEGSLRVFSGNRDLGRARPTRQYRSNLVSPLATNCYDFSDPMYFGIGHLAKSHMQRKPGRLWWEVVFEGQPFTGTPITNSLAATAIAATWTDLGLTGTELKQRVFKVPGHMRYKWRVRVEYPILRSIDGQRFSRWFYGYSTGHGDIGVLPIELTTFTGHAMDEGNMLRWTTASEEGSDRFIVERSPDLEAFLPIGEVAAAGLSSAPIGYQLFDPGAPPGLSYYRLRMLDLDGTEEPSEVITVTRAVADMALYPNPVIDLLRWELPSAGGTHVRVFDALGRAVIDLPDGGADRSAEVQALPDGPYTLVLFSAEGEAIARSRFVKVQAPIVR